MNLKKPYKSLGLISSRTGAAGQINAVDEAVKSTNTEVVSIELPRDTKGWGGHGCFIILGGENVSDVRRAVEISLEYIEKYAGELYISQAGHLEFTYSACADLALNIAFDAPVGRPFGFFCGSPAAIGLVMADLAVKASPVEIIRYMTPDKGTSHSNEVIVAVTGDASAVKDAVLTARETGFKASGIHGKLSRDTVKAISLILNICSQRQLSPYDICLFSRGCPFICNSRISDEHTARKMPFRYLEPFFQRGGRLYYPLQIAAVKHSCPSATAMVSIFAAARPPSSGFSDAIRIHDGALKNN